MKIIFQPNKNQGLRETWPITIKFQKNSKVLCYCIDLSRATAKHKLFLNLIYSRFCLDLKANIFYLHEFLYVSM